MSNWYERMNDALDYIEDQLLEEIDLNVVAKLTWSTAANFQRLFNIITEMPLSEYIRRRKMTMAALELQQSAIKVIELALKYGYESPEAFSRAFHHIHGLSPTQARKKGVQLTSFPRISFLLTIKGVSAMNYRIEQHQVMYMTGEVFSFSTANGEHLKQIPKVWEQLIQSGLFQKMQEDLKTTPLFEHLVAMNAVCCFDIQQTPDQMSYLVGALSRSKINAEDNYYTVEIPESTWAIFKTDYHTLEQTSLAIQKLIQRVYTEWLPTAKVTPISSHELELYYYDGTNYWTEYWIKIAQNL